MSRQGLPERARTARRSCVALALALGLCAAPALAQAPAAAPPAAPACDGMVELRLESRTNTRDPFDPGRDPATFPQAVLRLPRAGTYVRSVEGVSRWLRAGCAPATVTTVMADTQNVGRWAARFGIPYHDREPAEEVGFRLLFPSPPQRGARADRLPVP